MKIGHSVRTVGQFVQVTSSSVAAKKNKNVVNVQGLDGLPNGSLLLDVTFVVVQLYLLLHLLFLKVRCFNDSRMEKVLLLLLSVVVTLEDAEGQESKATTLGLMQLFRSDDVTPTPLFLNLYLVPAKFCKRIDCCSLLFLISSLEM
jgi:hypothetical protein